MFRSLNGKEEEAVTILDNRDVSEGEPNNDVLIICDHAVNDVKFMKVTDPEQGLIRSIEGYDAGAGDLASSLSERL